MPNFRCVIRDGETRYLGSPSDDQPPLTALWRLAKGDRSDLMPGRNRSKTTCDFAQHLSRIKVAGHNECGIVRLVISAVVGLLLFDGRTFDVLEPSHHRISIGMDFECSRFYFLDQKPP